MSAEGTSKSSSEILNELFSTFDPTFSRDKHSSKSSSKKSKKDKKKKRKKGSKDDSSSTDHSDHHVEKERERKKKEVVEVLTKKKKKKIKADGAGRKQRDQRTTSSVKKKKSAKPEPLDLEDGEILEDAAKGGSSSRKRKHVDLDSMSASQAFKLDAEERLLLGYYDERKSSGTSRQPHHSSPPPPVKHYQDEYKKTSSSHHHRARSRSPTHHHHHSSSSSSSSSRPRSPTTTRLAPPRDSYRSSYMSFKKQSDSYEDSSRYGGSSSSSDSRYYDTEKYYDYHSKRSRTDYATSRGFGYVSSKSYYYDDLEDPRDQPSSSSSGSRDSSRYGTSAWRHRNRSRSKSPPRRSYYHPDDILDKTELLEIARKNAKKLMRSGVLPSDIFSRDQILALKAGGKSVEELTSYCRRLAKRDAAGDARDDDDSGDETEERSRFIHHPFQVKDRPLPTITLNIRNSVPLPVRTPQELAIESAKLRTQFPVSSGTQHRFKELEWKPVQGEDSKDNALVPIDPVTGEPTIAPAAATASSAAAGESEVSSSSDGLLAIEAPPPKAAADEEDSTGISVDGPDLPAVDIGSVIGLRLKAMRTLQENPESDDAKKQLQEATQMMKHWADAKALEPKFLTPAELSSGPQAWAKRDQLRKTRALDSENMGMHLLQKMGWRPGEGLGKNKEGQLEPLALDVKTDKKGLTAAVEELMYGKRSGGGASGPSMPVVYDLSGKHPVSALMELTAKRRWGNPEFELCFEHGPSHKKQFVYKVIVNGVEYQPCVAVGNKKQAKANAAAFALQSLGLLPTAQAPPGAAEMLMTVPPEAPPTVPPTEKNPLNQQFSGGSLLQTVPQTDANLMPPPPPPPTLK